MPHTIHRIPCHCPLPGNRDQLTFYLFIPQRLHQVTSRFPNLPTYCFHILAASKLSYITSIYRQAYIYYSYLSASTGLIRDALNECQSTVSKTTAAAKTKVIANSHHEISVLKAKLLSQRLITNIVTGIENSDAITTKTKFVRRKENTIPFSELPKTFFSPISLVLDFTLKSVTPNKPKEAISKEKSAEIEIITFRFFSSA